MNGRDYYGMNIQLYLDNELIGQDLEEFHAHLEKCLTCRTELEAEEALSGLLHRSRPLHSAPDALRRRTIQAAELLPSTATHAPVRLRKHIAKILERPLRSAKRPSRPALVTAILPVAVGLVLVPGILRQSRANSYIEAAIAAHRSFLGGNLPLEVQSESPGIVTAWFAGKVPFPFRLPNSAEESGHEQLYRLVGGRLVNYKGGYAALVAYRAQQVGVRDNYLFNFLLTSGIKLHDESVSLVGAILSSCNWFLASTALKPVICCCKPFQAARVRL
jgi:anti-sigma factor RsiW